jgi:outer membrane lipoprotein-sorting protein
MSRLFCAAFVVTLLLGLANSARGADAATAATIEKAVNALGGDAKLSAIKAVQWRATGKFRRGENDNQATIEVTTQGPDRVRRVLEIDRDGQQFRSVIVLDGDRGWRKFRDNVTEMERDAVGLQKRALYLAAIADTVIPLKSDKFKVTAASDENVNGKPASVLKITDPDGKDSTLFLDRETGLPVKQVARVAGRGGDEFTQESTFSEYKDFDGIKRATKVVITRDGNPYQEFTVTDFKVLDKVDPLTFTEPQ